MTSLGLVWHTMHHYSSSTMHALILLSTILKLAAIIIFFLLQRHFCKSTVMSVHLFYTQMEESSHSTCILRQQAKQPLHVLHNRLSGTLCNLNGGTNLPHRRWIQSCATITRGCWCIVICTCTCCNNLWCHSAVWTQQGISSREFNAGNTCASWEWLDFEVTVTQIWKCQPSFTCKCFCLYLFWH